MHSSNIKKRARWYLSLAVVMLSGVLGVFGSSLVFAADDKTTGQLIVDDVLARPGKPAMLKAQLLQSGSGGIGLAGETVRFVVMGQHVGTALTDKAGRVSLEYKSQMRGNHKILGEVESSPRVNPVSGLGNYANWERRKPILLVDVVTLFKAREAADVSFGEPNAVLGAPDDDAPGELIKLGAFYFNIVYLLREETGNVEALRAWLKMAEFPPGITRRVPPGSETLLAFIEQLEEGGWDNVEAGIGHTKVFADTLVKNRIKAVIFPDSSKKEKFPRRAKIISEWKKVRKHL